MNQQGMKTQVVCRAFLKAHKGRVFDAMDATRLMNDEWGIKVDWHEMGYALDEMARCGLATITKPGGFVEYIIN